MPAPPESSSHRSATGNRIPSSGRVRPPQIPLEAARAEGIRLAEGQPHRRRPSTVSANIDELKSRAVTIREDILRSTTEAGSGHPSSSLSAAEVMTALYFGGFLSYDPKKPHWPDRDRFILSKGHAAPVLYAVLAEAGYFPKDELMTLRKLGSPLEGHPNMTPARRRRGVDRLARPGALARRRPRPGGPRRQEGLSHLRHDRRRRARRGAGLGGRRLRGQVQARQPHRDRRPQPLPADRRRRGGPEHGPDRRQVHRLRLADLRPSTATTWARSSRP